MVPFGFAFGLGFPRPPHQDLEDNRVRVCQGHMPQLSANPHSTCTYMACYLAGIILGKCVICSGYLHGLDIGLISRSFAAHFLEGKSSEPLGHPGA